MEKARTLNLRVNLDVKRRAEEVLELNTDLMTNEEIRTKLKEGYDDIAAGNMHNASEAFSKFREKH